MNTKKIDEIAIRTFNQAHPPGSKVYYRGEYRIIASSAYLALVHLGLDIDDNLPRVHLMPTRPGQAVECVHLRDLGDPT